MKAEFGVNLPQFSVGTNLRLDTINEFAELADNAGLHSLWVLENSFGNYDYLESLTLLTYAASLARNTKLGTALIRTPLRNPLVLANALSSLDFLSGARLIVGIGVGVKKEEFEGSGVPIGERGKRFEDGLELMKKLWTEDQVVYDNGLWRLQGATVRPRPTQKPHPPIWIGASKVTGAPLKRVARLGNGWLGAGASKLEDWISSWRLIEKYAAEYGRDAGEIERAKRVYVHIDPDRDKAKSILSHSLNILYDHDFDVEGKCVFGSASQVAESLDAYVRAGVRVFVMNTVEDHIKQLGEITRDIVPSFN